MRSERREGMLMRGAGNSIRCFSGMLTLGVFAAASLCGMTTPARAEEPEDPVPVETQDRGWFSLDRLDAYLEFETEFDQTRVRSRYGRRTRGPNSQSSRSAIFEERIGFTLGGDVVDPTFISFLGDFSFALAQSHDVERTPQLDDFDNDTGHLLLYDLRLNFFEGQELSGSVYAQRQDDRINRRFQPSLRERRTGFGTSWTFAHDTFPMSLSYDYSEADRTGNRDEFDDEHYTESTLRYGVDWIVSPHNRFKLSYEHAESKQEYQGLRRPFETTRDLFIIEHDLQFGPDFRHDLRTLVHWQEEAGDFARDFFQIGPQLTLRHSDDLQTMYKYQFNRERFEEFDVSTHRTDFQLLHQLYSNLTTTVDIFGLYEDIKRDVGTTQYGATVDWQYNRRNSYGRFDANLSVAWDIEKLRGGNGSRIVLNEAATFRDPLPVRLRNRNVRRLTIVVTDTTNRRFFVPGLDYRVVVTRDVTRLVRIRTGRIADGDTVLVDYQYASPAGGRVDTVRVDFALEQRFDNGWTPYYRFGYRDEDVDARRGFARFADRTDHHRLGVRYEKEAYSLGCEFEIFDDTVEPYDAFHLDGIWHIAQTAAHNLDASSRLDRFFFEGGVDRRNVTIINLELDHRWRLREDLSTFERVAFRWEDDSADGLTHAWDVTAGVDYVIGDFTAQLALEYDRLDLPRSEEDDFGVFLRVRREIPNVLARR